LAGHLARTEKMKYAYIFVGRPGRNRPHGKYRHRWYYNIGMDFKEIVWEVWTRFIWFIIGTNGGLL